MLSLDGWLILICMGMSFFVLNEHDLQFTSSSESIIPRTKKGIVTSFCSSSLPHVRYVSHT